MQITALYSGLLGLILVYLSYNVAGHRKSHQVGIGHGDNDDLGRAIRVQANFTEYVPVALILIAVFESNQGSSLITHSAGATLVIARLLHAYGLGKTINVSFGRLSGIILTWLVILAISVLNIYHFVASAQLSQIN